MPITKSAKKALRQSARRRNRNIVKMEQMRKAIKDVKKAMSRGKREEARKIASQAYKAIDKAAKTGVIKKNTAARKKARLMTRINQAAVSSNAKS